MAKKATAVDLGSHGVRVLEARLGKHGVQITRFASAAASDGPAEVSGRVAMKDCVVGLAGRAMTLKYTRVPPGPDTQLESLMELEIADMSTQSGGSLSADFNLLQIQSEDAEDETVVLALARDEALAEQTEAVASANGSIAGHVPNCVALYNAWLKCGTSDPDEVVCLVNLGHETIDLALVRGVDLLFVRNLTGGGRVLDDAIAAAFSVGSRKAEQLKKELLDLDPESRGRFASGQAEKVTMAAGGAASAFVAAVQSSLAFCKAQTGIADLRLDRVLISGGSARIRGVRGMLRESLRCPVEVFDPFEACDLSALDADGAEALEDQRYEAVVALGLAIGRIDEEAYDLTILPESVKRRRRFMQRTVWNIAAALVLVGAVYFVFSDQSAKEATAQKVLQRVRGDVSSRQAVDSDTREVLAEAERLAAANRYLAEQAVPLNGLLGTARLLQKHMPRELYVTDLSVTTPRGRTRGSRGEERQLIRVVGTGKEVTGRSVGEVYDEFVAACRADTVAPGGQAPVIKVTNETGQRFGFTWDLDFSAQDEGEDDASTDEGGR
jgi:type IV pilus assembly protein PilM